MQFLLLPIQLWSIAKATAAHTPFHNKATVPSSWTKQLSMALWRNASVCPTAAAATVILKMGPAPSGWATSGITVAWVKLTSCARQFDFWHPWQLMWASINTLMTQRHNNGKKARWKTWLVSEEMPYFYRQVPCTTPRCVQNTAEKKSSRNNCDVWAITLQIYVLNGGQ